MNIHHAIKKVLIYVLVVVDQAIDSTSLACNAEGFTCMCCHPGRSMKSYSHRSGLIVCARLDGGLGHVKMGVGSSSDSSTWPSYRAIIEAVIAFFV